MAITKATGGVIKDGEITEAKLAAGAAASADNVSLLGFKVATADSLAIFNMKDGIIDDYQDATGVDASASTNEIRESSGKYYSGSVAGSYTIDAYTDASGTGEHTKTFAAGTTEAEILIVAGGGAGHGSYYGGGGGAGGIVYDADYAVTAGIAYDIVVGDKGAGANNAMGTSGEDSVWNVNAEGSGITLTAAGGGKAGDYDTDGVAGGSGGAGMDGAASNQASFSGAVSYGNAGGDYTSSQGGGGGASAAGGDGDGGRGGAGGAGQLFSTFVAYGTDSSNIASTGSNGGYFGGGGGGGGGGNSDLYGLAGVGGGGIGGQYAGGTMTAPWSAMANTGGGGGGSSHNTGTTGGDGGTGVVLIRSRPYTNNDMTLISNAQTAQAAPLNSRVCLLMDPAVGTTTINTDVKAYVSRDNGTTYSQVTLADEGTYSGTQKILAGTVDVSGQPSGTSMRYKITTHNQSATKTTRIYGTSLSWQ